MSIVFDARKNADRSKRAREAIAHPPQSPGPPPESADPQSVASSNEPARLPKKPHEPTITDAAAIDRSQEISTRTGLDFKAERRTTDWRLRWNRNCAVNAVRGRLSIEDGAAHKQLDLDVAELRTGSIVYAPVTNEVLFRLQVIRPEPEDALSESVRVVAGGVSARSLSERNRRVPLADKQGMARIARSNGAWVAGAEMRPGKGIRNGPASVEGPTVRALLRTPYRHATPSVDSSSVAGSVQSEATVAEENDKVEPAMLIARTDPVYPAIARQSRISGSVEVQFRISPDGRVYDVKSLKGWPILAKAAIDAVATWRYEPARLNGTPVESEARTNFDFQMS